MFLSCSFVFSFFSFLWGGGGYSYIHIVIFLYIRLSVTNEKNDKKLKKNNNTRMIVLYCVYTQTRKIKTEPGESQILDTLKMCSKKCIQKNQKKFIINNTLSISLVNNNNNFTFFFLVKKIHSVPKLFCFL